MAVAEDASTPAVTRSPTSWTTTTLSSPSFTPPAGSLLVITANTCDTSAFTPTPTLSASVSAGGTPTQLYQAADTTGGFDFAGCWYLYLSTSPGAITVTLTRSDTIANSGQLAVRVLTGTAQTASLLTGVVVNNITTTNGTQASVTPGSIGSQLYVATEVDRTAGTLTPATGTTNIDSFLNGTIGVNQAFGKSTALTSTTSAQVVGYTSAGSGAGTDSILQIIEVPPATAAGPRPPLAVRRAARIRSAHF